MGGVALMGFDFKKRVSELGEIVPYKEEPKFYETTKRTQKGYQYRYNDANTFMSISVSGDNNTINFGGGC